MTQRARPAILTNDDATIDLACESIYRFLAAALGHPRNLEWRIVRDPRSRQFATAAADYLAQEFADRSVPLGFGELPANQLDVRPFLESLATSDDEAAAEYQRVFGLIPCRECPPYESEYLSIEDTFFRTQQMADVAGFYRAFGLDPMTASRERPDHICLELEFSAFLLLKEREAAARGDDESLVHVETCRQARRDFFHDHLGWWSPAFALGLRRKAETGPYAELGRLLAAFLPVERQRFGIKASPTPREPNVVDVADECEGCLVQLNDMPQ
jgi:DMSO reductase family type II enzyme chaperone